MASSQEWDQFPVFSIFETKNTLNMDASEMNFLRPNDHSVVWKKLENSKMKGANQFDAIPVTIDEVNMCTASCSANLKR